jgi:ethanolaminephosphotransferase
MGPFWNWFVNIYPLWLAPNMITLIGFIVISLGIIPLIYYDVSD